MRRAFTRLRNGRGGPVLVEIPTDVLERGGAGAAGLHAGRRAHATAPIPAHVTRGRAAMLVAAKRPVIYAGQGVH